MTGDKEYQKKWREAHKAQLAAYQREYRKTYKLGQRRSLRFNVLAELFKKGLTTKKLLEEVRKLIPPDMLEAEDGE